MVTKRKRRRKRPLRELSVIELRRRRDKLERMIWNLEIHIAKMNHKGVARYKYIERKDKLKIEHITVIKELKSRRKKR